MPTAFELLKWNANQEKYEMPTWIKRSMNKYKMKQKCLYRLKCWPGMTKCCKKYIAKIECHENANMH